MSTTLALAAIAVLFATAVAAVAIGRGEGAHRIVYGVSLAVSMVLTVVACSHLVAAATPSTATLPLGLPWLGSRFRIDALAAFFLGVVNLGAAAASLFALGYGRHEDAPLRVL